MSKKYNKILAFGDSLTRGFGAREGMSYPSQIKKKTSIDIINAGINGEFSYEGVQRLPYLLGEHKPDLVILCHGGNDIINNLSITELKTNLIKMIDLIQQHNAEVLLVGVPDYTYLDSLTHEVYDVVAYETKVALEDSIMSDIYKLNSLKSDYVHPNAKGYEMMAERFIKYLSI